MSQIRHLELGGLCLPLERPNQEGCIVLRNLHTFSGVKNLRLTEDVCRRMPNIKKFSLVYDSFPPDREENSYYCLENLGQFNKMESMECKFVGYSKWHNVVISLVFPDSLEELILWNCHLNWEVLTKMIKSLSHLGYLELHNIKGHEWDLADEEFPRLQILGIYNCDDLVDWNAGSSHFPVLESLYITSTPNLREIPYGIGEISILGYISIVFSMFAAISATSMVVEQESIGNQDLRAYICFMGKKDREEFQSMVGNEALTSINITIRQMYNF